MKKAIPFLVAVILWSCSKDVYRLEDFPGASGIENVLWVRSFGGAGDDTPRSVIQTMDGGYAVLGFTNSTNGDLAFKNTVVNDYWLLKLNADGEVQWQRTYGGSGDDRGQQVIQTSDGGYALAGYAMSDDGDGSNNEGFHDNWIIRLDSSGNILWEKSFGFSGHDHSYDIVETVDGGFFFSGFLDVTSSNGEGATSKTSSLSAHGVGEFWGTRIDAQGNLLWRKFFGGTNNDRSFGVVNAEDGGFVLAGASESDDFDISNPKGSYDFWVVKVNKNGDMEWERSFGGSGIDQAQDIIRTKDGAYVIVGNTFSADTQVSKNNGESDVWLIKIDDNGNLLWQQSFGGSNFEAAHGVYLASDGGLLIAGNSKSNNGDASENFGENDLWLIKTDSEGNLDYQRSFGGSDLDFGYDVLESSEGAVILVGETASTDFPQVNPNGGIDLVVIKLE
ncbi:MAG: hypothetical protein ED555_03630 [Allomuricauda sp.]|nr:MAG: hypothetical protein ED555_03630 [Allomuricauda sp.]